MKIYTMLAMAALLSPTLAAEEWNHLGTGTLLDGWVTPGIHYPTGEVNPANYVFEVEIYESAERAGVYKLASPWTSEKYPFLEYNSATTPHDIIIDATDPTFVRIEPQESGFVHKSPQSSNWSDPFYLGCMGSYYESEGNSVEDIKSYGFASTLEDGKINIKACFGRYSAFLQTVDLGYQWSTYPSGETVVTLPSENPAVWIEKGEVTFVDGWITPGYLGNPEHHAWKVKYEEMEGTPGLYRLTDPWHAEGCPLRASNDCTTAAYLVVDATDPAVVIIEPQQAGFTDEIASETYNFFIGNDAGILYQQQLMSPDDIKQYFPKRCDALRDGIITIAKPLFGPNSQNVGVQWIDQLTGQPLPYGARIIFPGADDTPIEPEPGEERDRTFYEGFEAGSGVIADDWIPAGWEERNTPDSKPTPLQLSHNVNNSWWCAESSDFYQDMTLDGTKEMYIHFSYDSDQGWCRDAAQDEWLITPEMQLTDDEQLHFLLQADIFKAFDYALFDLNTMKFSERRKVHTLKVMVSTDGGDTWQEAWDWADAVAPDLTDRELWDEGYLHLTSHTIDLADYAGKRVRLAFRYLRDAGSNTGNSMILDRVVVDHPRSASVALPAVDADPDAPAVYYDLRGMRVADIHTAAPGIYIERRGNATRKIVK
ncbi:MAG: immune inhibitor A [Bacteroides sp.]|nr:immune inhibitor A [Bacteroides sp.]MCM1096223.1 immune inhibitor A [Terasakiella sp.]